MAKRGYDGAMTQLQRLGLLATLYFAQGLPYGFFAQALPVLLRKARYSLSAIGLTSLLAMPWALKFLWAPVVDRVWWSRLGRRRSWILAMQLAGTIVLALLAIAPPAIWLLMASMVVLNTIAATQDVATDGMAVDMLPASERGAANGIQVAGYRVGMIIGGGVLLSFYGEVGHHGTFAVMAGLTVLASIPVLAMREPTPAVASSATTSAVHFLRLPGVWRVLALVFAWKFGESFAQGMLRPFLVDLHLGLDDIALLLGTVGFVSGMLGALVGGLLVTRVGRRRSLIAFGIAQVIAVAGYAYLAFVDPSFVELYGWCAVEHFASGMATAALFTCMMDWSRPASSGTDYTVQASTVVIAQGGAATLSGFSADALGYGPHFVVAAALCVVAVVLATMLYPERFPRAVQFAATT